MIKLLWMMSCILKLIKYGYFYIQFLNKGLEKIVFSYMY